VTKGVDECGVGFIDVHVGNARSRFVIAECHVQYVDNQFRGYTRYSTRDRRNLFIIRLGYFESITG